MLNRKKIRKMNQRAQIGETMTWIIATIIVVVILSVFIYASSFLAKTKTVSLPDLKIGLGEEVDLIAMKSFFAYEKTPVEKRDVVDKWFERENEK